MLAGRVPAPDSSGAACAGREELQPTTETIEMFSITRGSTLAAVGMAILAGCASTQPSQPNPKDMTFFMTSVGPGKGADLGGLDGADRHCQSLAKAAGAGDRNWRAYLSTQGSGLSDPKFVNARDRIGSGPWQNAMGVVIARSVDELHSPANNLTKETALDETGRPVNGRTEKPNKHDVLTGSRPDGTAFPGSPFPDMTCGNWTKGGRDGSAMLGHHDRAGPIASPWATSWNSSHPSLGCHPEGLRSTGGDGLFYCFAAK
jgi:hypothetical protein